jgi:GTPase SAR1 family protein
LQEVQETDLPKKQEVLKNKIDWTGIFEPGEKNVQTMTMAIGLLGMMAVGKTSIIKKFVDPEKMLEEKNSMSTIGVD